MKQVDLSLLALFVVLCFASMGATGMRCNPDPIDPSGVGGSQIVDSGPGDCLPQGYDNCGLAGTVLCQLQCRDRDGVALWRTPAGRSFGEVCRAAAADGRDWRPACIARIVDCSQVETAYRGGAPCIR